jgi:hypothetical protein
VIVLPESTATISTKSAIEAAGGGTLALAIAMLENSTLLCDYVFGDKAPDGCPKIEDAANFGIYKMNWFMLQECPSVVAILGSYNQNCRSNAWAAVGTKINDDLTLTTKLLLEAMAKWSTDAPIAGDPIAGNFWAGHRWGETGLNNPTAELWNDIIGYYSAVQAIKGRCDTDDTVWTSNVRYYVDVPPV